ncbi:MAG: hypothetical protein K2H64_01900 [Desulfovibrio sp.]|nr:hypothetical protein [Desulfovibrio sp.]
MIEGINIRCNVGPFEVLRSPRVVLTYARRAVVSTCEIVIPDPDGQVCAGLEKKQKVKIRFGHRGEGGTWHEWEGTIKDFTAELDAMRVFCVGLEQALIDTKITQAMHGEPADIVAKRLFGATGLAVDKIEIEPQVFPHIVFSDVTVARAIKQLSQSLERSFGIDMSAHAVWLGENGLCWSAGNEPGPTYIIETAQNLISCSPNPRGMSYVVSTLIPGLTASMEVRIRDKLREYSELVRAEEVIHTLSGDGNTTKIGYGVNSGWG